MVSQELPERIGEDSIRTIRSAISQLREERNSFQAFIDGVLDGLEDMRVELLDQEKSIQQTRSDLVLRQEQLDLALVKAAEASKINTESQAEIKQLKRNLEDLTSQVERLESERDDALGRMNAAVDELSAVADALDLVQATERELSMTRDELTAAKDQLKKFKGEANTADVEQLKQLKQEKEQLESELKESRLEAESLSEKVADQRRQLSAQRDRMSKDLDGLRTAVQSRVKSLRD